MKDIPCIDFALLANGTFNEDEFEEEKKICQNIVSAFAEIGFVYLKNHGIPRKLIENIHKVGQEFFSLPEEEKLKYEKDLEVMQGYVAIDREFLMCFHRLHISKDIHELRESFDASNPNGDFPSEVKDLKKVIANVMEEGVKFSNKLLRCLEVGLELPNGTLMDKHENPFSSLNGTLLRILHYPPIPENAKDGLIRCGAHTDYGTFTLLFQDDIGGLEVKRRDGKWINDDPIPDTILVNVGDLLQMWTAGRLLATVSKLVNT
ncbi:1-aminocyclopropane-1-carboxylate oxidase [Armadillidium nasatum]|uniref:1-aminocyclopropane-1-carboxylate oxidase n=1 Tax=Armadillidium nasatum TaxID=96803 RepID=A0A5N5SSV9_9CRUS|nr:1-aminocyclopropane-1-carboxylate oxidase [Armadillidium nasatum]